MRDIRKRIKQATGDERKSVHLRIEYFSPVIFGLERSQIYYPMKAFNLFLMFALFLIGPILANDQKLVIRSLLFDEKGVPCGISGELTLNAGKLPDLLFRFRDREVATALPTKNERAPVSKDRMEVRSFSINFMNVFKSSLSKPGNEWELGSFKGNRKDGGLAIGNDGVLIYRDEVVSVILRVP